MTITWNAQNDARLLLIILQVHNIKVDYAKCAEQFGQGASGEAIRSRIRGLLRAGVGCEGGGGGGGSASATPSPRKRKNQKVTEGGITKKRGGGKMEG
ncbi:hypothetical protein K440DRAFT_633020 [Wilcoxina mikolae CBS 423.85]|nr:hypothetical protein K440DRAFT_633020 [Wilcoxina mikolae CBS 423.85]